MNNLKIYKKKQKTAIITGASEGNGAAFSRLLIILFAKLFSSLNDLDSISSSKFLSFIY